MSSFGDKRKSSLLFQSKKPISARKEMVKVSQKPNLISRFRDRLQAARASEDHSRSLKESFGSLTESGKEARAWLERAQKVVSDRTEHIENIEEKERFSDLAASLKNAIPAADATDEDVEQSLRLLKQTLEDSKSEDDSKHLRDVKSHLALEISGILGSAPNLPV